jgi:hypothetical protein
VQWLPASLRLGPQPHGAAKVGLVLAIALILVAALLSGRLDRGAIAVVAAAGFLPLLLSWRRDRH